MKFTDGINQINPSVAFIKKSEKEFAKMEESNSLSWDIEKPNISYDKTFKSPVHLYKVPLRAIKIGGDIYDREGNWVGYRAE